MQSVRVGIIGCGVQGARRARALQGIDGLELVAVTDTDWAQRDKLAAELGCPASQTAMMNSDLVVIATPPNEHHRLIRWALERGQHVLCEKPLTLEMDLWQGDELRKFARDRHLLLRAGFHLRHYPGVQRLYGLLKTGVFGGLTSIDIEYGSKRPTDFVTTWRADPAIAGGGVLIDQGVHALDLAVCLADRPLEVRGALRTTSGMVAPDIDDDARVLLTDGITQVYVHSSWVDWNANFTVRVNGCRARATLSGLQGNYGMQVLRVNPGLASAGSWERGHYDDPFDPWRAEWLDILAELNGLAHIGSDGVDATRLLVEARSLA